MEKSIANLLLSERLREVDSDLLRIYLVLRADIAQSGTSTVAYYKQRGELVSGLLVHTISLFSGIPELTVTRMLDDLIRRGWIKSVHDGAISVR